MVSVLKLGQTATNTKESTGSARKMDKAHTNGMMVATIREIG